MNASQLGGGHLTPSYGGHCTRAGKIPYEFTIVLVRAESELPV